MADRKLVVGIDFNNMVFGSYYGQSLINSKGMNVNAIKGFFFKIKALKDMFSPDYIVIANDLSREKTFRRKLYKQYKAQRKPHDEDIMKQMKYTSQLTALLGYPFINNELYEADDVLGMISKYTYEHDMDFVMASSDKDLYQLVNDKTFVLSAKDKELIDPAWMMDNYRLTPDQWIELKMLQGDTSDNIPGIRGVGKITALKLMQQFGSIDEIYSNLNNLQPKLKDILLAGKDILPLTRDLVTIITDYTKIGLTGEMLNRKEVFESEIYGVLADLELYSLLNVMNYSLINDKQVLKDYTPTNGNKYIS